MCVVRDQLPEMLKKMRPYAIQLAGQDADDLLQQTAFRALKNSHQFEPGTNLGNWLYAILRNQFLSDCRRVKGRKPMPLEEAPPDFVTYDERQTGAIFCAEVREAIRQLNVGQQEVITMIGEQEMGYDEAASALGISIGTIKSRLWRCRAHLRKQLELA